MATLGHMSIGKHMSRFFLANIMSNPWGINQYVKHYYEYGLFNSTHLLAWMLSLAWMWIDPTADLLLGLPDRCFPALTSVLWSFPWFFNTLPLSHRAEYPASAACSPFNIWKRIQSFWEIWKLFTFPYFQLNYFQLIFRKTFHFLFRCANKFNWKM